MSYSPQGLVPHLLCVVSCERKTAQAVVREPLAAAEARPTAARNVADLVRERPDSIAALRRVRGIGQAKAERHGEALLMLLRGDAPGSGPTLVPTAAAVADTLVSGAATADIDAPTEAVAEA